MKGRGLSILAALAVVIALVAIAVSTSGSGSPTVTVPSKNGPSVVVPTKDLNALKSNGAGHHAEGGLGNEQRATPQDLKRDNKAASPLTPSFTGPVPQASPQQAGCLTRQISHNWSFRNGTKPSLVVLHYTVSHNVVGWGDVNAIFAFFNISATQASSNYVMDGEGHCIYMVPETYKAWAQAGFNSATACSIEVIDYGTESSYISTAAGKAQIGRIVRDCAARWHIPLRHGAVSGCSVTRSGVVEHANLGLCGGGHHDIQPFSVDSVIGYAKGQSSKPKPAALPPSKVAVNDCRGVVAYRVKAAKHVKQGSGATVLYVKRVKALAKGHYICGRHGATMVLRRA